MDFGINSIEALKNLIDENSQDDQHVYGSAIHPGNVGTDGKQKKELAKPNTKVEVKTYNRDTKGGATQEALKAAQEKKKKEDKTRDIWEEEEVNIAAEELHDDRPQPEFEVLHKQHVGTEDTYLGLSDKDPSSIHCDSILVKIQLPNTKFRQVQLDIKKQMLYVQSPNYVLKHTLPYPVEKEKGKAQFDSDKCILSVTLPVIKRSVFDEF